MTVPNLSSFAVRPAAWLLLFIMALAGCSSSGPDQAPAAATPDGTTSESEADEAGDSDATSADADTLIVGTDPTHPPHDFLDEDGNIIGWEHEFILAVAEEMGREVKYEAASFDALIPGLSSGRFDLVFANMGITEERLEQVDMVTAFRSGQAFLGRQDSNLDIPDLSALCGVSVGVTRGSTQAELSREQSEKCEAAGDEPVGIETFQTGDQIILAVEAGRVDTYWTAEPIAQYYANEDASELAVVGEVPGTKSPTAIALPKGSELTEPVHAAVSTLIENGGYMQVLENWNLENGAIDKSEINPAP